MTIDPELSEADVVARVQAGERAAFAILVRRYGPVARRAAAVLGAGADTDDVVQEAFVKAYRALAGFRPDAEFRPWVLSIVANETRNAQRARRRRSLRERSPAAVDDNLLPGMAAAADPAQVFADRERLAGLREAVMSLPEPQRLVVGCRYLLGLDEAETAQVLGIAPGTVKSRTHRAFARIRKYLGNQAVESAQPVGEADHG